MIVESLSILAISICMLVVFIRAGHPDYAASLTPIMLLPLLHLVAQLILRISDRAMPWISYRIILAFVDIGALAISSILLFFFSGKIKSNRNKRLYLYLLCGYSVILTCAYVYQTLTPLFA